jgi:hypothetical protein
VSKQNSIDGIVGAKRGWPSGATAAAAEPSAQVAPGGARWGGPVPPPPKNMD